MRALPWAVLGLLVGCACFAAEPETVAPDAQPAAATAEGNPKSEASADQQPASTPPQGVETKVEGSNAEQRRAFKPPAGFKAKIHGWDVVYCRKMPVLGSRFPKEVCMSEAQLKDQMAANESMRQNKDQTSRICSSAAGCGM